MTAWLANARHRLANAVGDDESVYDLDGEMTRRLLDLARIAAHESNDRTNAPLLAYLVGLAHGRHPERTLSDLSDAAVDGD
jgi:hypothetical protein